LRRTPSKELTIEPFEGRVTVTADGTTIASSTRAKLLSEPPYPGAYYIPFEDVDFTHLAKTDRSTHCPYKGDASYWSVLPAGARGGQRDVGLRASVRRKRRDQRPRRLLPPTG
jgi:uncharacterized protein (DUF427 family)